MTKYEKKLLNRQIKSNKSAGWVATIFAWLLVIIFLGLIGFIIYYSIPGFQAYGFKNIIFNDSFNINVSDPSQAQASVWLPLAVTLIITVGALLISTPLAIKTSMFIHFRVSTPSLKKFLKILINIIAAIPSVIFGLFAFQSLGVMTQKIFHLDSPNTVITSIIMMTFMLIPTQVSLILNACEGVDTNLINYAMSLGNTKSKAIYKVFRSQIRKSILISIIIAAGRAIGETMAVSMILSSQNYNDIFSNGLIGILKSSLSPLGSVISQGMFSENGGDEMRGLLYAFGIVMFVFVMIINIIIMVGSRNKKSHNNNWFSKIETNLSSFLMIVPNQLGMLWEKITYHPSFIINSKNYESKMSEFITTRIQNNKSMLVYSGYKLFWEWVCTLIVFGFLAWIVLAILANGFYAWGQPSSTVFNYGKDTTGQAFLNTILLILISIVISLPLSLMIAIWLNEYAKSPKIKKAILFFLDSLGSTPSIIFGMFGLIFFIEILGLTSAGSIGKSLLAGALTIILVILPTFTRMIQQSLEAVPLSIRENSYALGNSKWYTIRKLVLPTAYKSVVSSVIITIGRILAETAPLYLTAGLSSASSVALMNPGQTLTTRIYAQLYSNNSAVSTNIMWESALVVLLLVVFLIVLGYVIIPLWPQFKEEFMIYWNIQKTFWKSNRENYHIQKYESQIQNNVLYLTYNQAKELGIDITVPYQVIKYKKRRLPIKLMNYKKMVKMQDDVLFYKDVLNNDLNPSRKD